jgi:glyoxylase-like metal-dependent hydrolase (beta-lactamase superfamily II)
LEIAMGYFLRWVSVAACFSLVSCAESEAPAIALDYPLKQLTDRVYVIHGPNEEPNKKNQGFMNNPAFVLTSKGVVVIDPGSSLQVGRLLLGKIAKTTPSPVIAVFNTHIHGDHWLGNQAVREAYPNAVIYAHPNMLAKAQGEGEFWLKNMLTLTAGATMGTRLELPDSTLENDDTLRLGDRHFRVYHTGKAHTDGDLMLEVVEEKLMFLGDVVMAQRAGRLDDGDFKGNIAAIDAVLKSQAVHFVPGHGLSGGRELPLAYRAFLSTLYASVKQYYTQGLADFDMKDKVNKDLAAYQQWAMFDTGLGRLISLAYLQAEAESF